MAEAMEQTLLCETAFSAYAHYKGKLWILGVKHSAPSMTTRITHHRSQFNSTWSDAVQPKSHFFQNEVTTIKFIARQILWLQRHSPFRYFYVL